MSDVVPRLRRPSSFSKASSKEPHMKFRFPRRRLVVFAVLAVVVASSVYAYAATNTVPATAAGSGAAAISGYTITSVVYGLNASTPTNLDELSA